MSLGMPGYSLGLNLAMRFPIITPLVAAGALAIPALPPLPALSVPSLPKPPALVVPSLPKPPALVVQHCQRHRR